MKWITRAQLHSFPSIVEAAKQVARRRPGAVSRRTEPNGLDGSPVAVPPTYHTMTAQHVVLPHRPR